MKKLLITVIAALFVTAFSIPVFANSWQRDSVGWKYQFDDGKYAANSWQSIDNVWYFFNSKGYMLTDQWIDGLYYVGSDGAMLKNATTPDGYRVDANGKYIPDAKKAKPVSTAKSSQSSGNQSATRTTKSKSTGDSSANYIGNANSMKFHYAYCSSVKKMADHNKVPLDSREEAIAGGYVPCKNCKP